MVSFLTLQLSQCGHTRWSHGFILYTVALLVWPHEVEPWFHSLHCSSLSVATRGGAMVSFFTLQLSQCSHTRWSHGFILYTVALLVQPHEVEPWFHSLHCSSLCVAIRATRGGTMVSLKIGTGFLRTISLQPVPTEFSNKEIATVIETERCDYGWKVKYQ